ncbi:MAG: hypothetical protein K1V77_06275 [Muribaculaceae bacterium]
MNYPFRLGRMAIRCPRCGHREFKPFVDAAGRILDPTCGRCNRELKCGYFLPPSRRGNLDLIHESEPTRSSGRW